MLEMSGIRAGYGQSLVLDGLSLRIAEGEVVCLLGANGAGKTTTTRVVCGLLRASAGEIRFEGVPIDRVPAHRRIELGICLSPEGRQVFPNMSVQENLLLGAYSGRARPNRRRTLDEVYDLFPRLRERRAQRAGLMSGGEQQMLAIGRALMGRPRLLILDEPSLGLAPKIVLDVYAAVAATARSGVSILFVEQNAEAALSAADRGYVLANGVIAESGSAAELHGSDAVQQAFLGKLGDRRRRRTAPLVESGAA
ncbi:MAG: ABC transporter ATP-binding protein [Alphaproteobacteria bacterium]|nr:ABC transporter ATP-binding protein [Alphaproteobacteria bacterium]